MAFAVTTERSPRLTRVRVSGPTSIKDFVELIQSMAGETALWNDKNLLVDLRDVDGRLEDAEQVFVGELVGHMLSHLNKMASVVPPDQITRNSERAAVQLGMQLRVFVDEAEAVAWLKATGP